MPYDLLISGWRRDNGKDRFTRLVERIKADFVSLAARSLVLFLDPCTIQIRKEVPWQN